MFSKWGFTVAWINVQKCPNVLSLILSTVRTITQPSRELWFSPLPKWVGTRKTILTSGYCKLS